MSDEVALAHTVAWKRMSSEAFVDKVANEMQLDVRGCLRQRMVQSNDASLWPVRVISRMSSSLNPLCSDPTSISTRTEENTPTTIPSKIDPELE